MICETCKKRFSQDNACYRSDCPNLFIPYPCTTPDHFVMPEDPEEKAGWGWLSFDTIMKPFRHAVLWHEKITEQCSFAERIKIPNWRVAQAWREMLAEEAKDFPGNGIVQRTAWAAGWIVAGVNRWFYGGPTH